MSGPYYLLIKSAVTYAWAKIHVYNQLHVKCRRHHARLFSDELDCRGTSPELDHEPEGPSSANGFTDVAKRDCFVGSDDHGTASASLDREQAAEEIFVSNSRGRLHVMKPGNDDDRCGARPKCDL